MVSHSTTEVADALVSDYMAYKSNLQRRTANAPVYVNRASSLGHPCNLFNYYERTAYDKKQAPDETLACIFDEGNLQESKLTSDLTLMGWRVTESWKTVEDKGRNIVGHIDGKLQKPGVFDSPIVFDAKSTSPYTFNTLKRASDFLEHRYHYIRSYPGQLLIYCLLENESEGMMVLKNKVTGVIRPIVFNMDDSFDIPHGSNGDSPLTGWDIAEKALMKAETINKSVSSDTPPPSIEYTESICGSCSFNHICPTAQSPDKEGTALNIEGLVDLLEERAVLIDQTSSHTKSLKRLEEINSEIKVSTDGIDNWQAGRWTGKGTRVSYATKPQPAKEIDYWRVTSIREIK